MGIVFRRKSKMAFFFCVVSCLFHGTKKNMVDEFFQFCPLYLVQEPLKNNRFDFTGFLKMKAKSLQELIQISHLSCIGFFMDSKDHWDFEAG